MKILNVVVFVVLLSGCHAINQRFGLEDDNVIEEVAEAVLKKETGIDLDFTPDTPEHKD